MSFNFLVAFLMAPFVPCFVAVAFGASVEDTSHEITRKVMKLERLVKAQMEDMEDVVREKVGEVREEVGEFRNIRKSNKT